MLRDTRFQFFSDIQIEQTLLHPFSVLQFHCECLPMPLQSHSSNALQYVKSLDQKRNRNVIKNKAESLVDFAEILVDRLNSKFTVS